MTSSGASIACARGRAVERERAAVRAVEHEVAGDRDAEPIRVERRPACRHAAARRRPGRPAASRTAASARRALPAAPAIRPQFGSRPWAAALTRLRRDDRPGDGPRLGVVGRAGHLAGDQRRGALAVGGLLAGEVAGDRLDRGAERDGRRRCRPRPARPRRRPDARTKTVSFVLVSPSTLSWSQVRAAAGRSSPRGRLGLDGRVGQHDRRASSPSAGGSSRRPWRSR